MDDVERLLILNMVEDLGSIRTRKLFDHFGSLERIFKVNECELLEVQGIGPKIALKIIQSIKEIDITQEMALIKRHNIKVIGFLDKDYPDRLKNIYAPPCVLYVKGEILPQDDIAVAIVGSRKASFYGTRTAERLGFELASRGITVVSGLARGIDSSAHQGALKAKGRTLAILGSGLLNIYPEEHASLAERISKGGAVISEFPMMTIPDKGNFPKRNRIISGLSMGVVVVEAAERSGALITADFAINEGRDVFAVPGKVDSRSSKGTNRLIKQGAKLVENVEDILGDLGLEIQTAFKDKQDFFTPTLDKDQTLVYNLVSTDSIHIDELSEVSGIGLSGLSRILLDLEMRKLVRQLPGKNFVRV